MDVTLTAISESQWTLCLLQITILMAISWIVGRVALRRFPDISASIGVVALSVSAGLIALTWADVPRPFQLTVQTTEATESISDTEPVHPISERVESTVELPPSPPSWLGNLTGMFTGTGASSNQNATAESTWQWVNSVQVATVLLWLTLLGGMVGIFRIVHSSITIHGLARCSSPVQDDRIQSEVTRILALLPILHQHQAIAVRQYDGAGSPFVSWLTGKTIFVPESFLNWSDSEQSVSLAHEIGHLQRRDHYCRLITQFTFCLTWLHPLAWILHRQTLLAQELAADQMAAQATQNPSAYCRSLSQLALRFDAQCRHPSALGVSVSSSLIRRITMLKEINFHRLPCSRLVNRCITLFAFIACTWIGCWSVLGQNTPQETQPESKVVAASHTTPTTMFSQPATAPWEVLGSQPGYYHLQFSRLKDHPYIKANLLGLEIDESLTDLFRSEPNEAPSLKQFGISLEKITQLQGGIGFFYSFDPDQPSGNPYAVGFTMPKAEVTAINPVDWPSLIKALDFEKLQANFLLDSKVDSKVDVNAIRDTWLESAEKSRAYTFDTSMALGPSSSMPLPRPTETKKAMWETVSGGAATVLYDIVGVEAYPEDYQESDEVNRINHEMTVATETAAWGIDFSPDFLTHQVRFVAVPKDGVSADELLKKFEALKAAFARHPEYKDLPGYLREPFNNSKATIVQSTQRNGETTKPYLLIEGECTLTLAQFIDL